MHFVNDVIESLLMTQYESFDIEGLFKPRTHQKKVTLFFILSLRTVFSQCFLNSNGFQLQKLEKKSLWKQCHSSLLLLYKKYDVLCLLYYM